MTGLEWFLVGMFCGLSLALFVVCTIKIPGVTM